MIFVIFVIGGKIGWLVMMDLCGFVFCEMVVNGDQVIDILGFYVGVYYVDFFLDMFYVVRKLVKF